MKQQWVSRYRDELKGFAILWIVFFHSLLPCTGVLADVQKLGYGGVDIFFFLTGFGLFRSLQKNDDLRDYLRRRLWRLLPAYWLFILAWLLVMLPGYGLSAVETVRTVLGNLFMVAYWLDVPKVFNWYVSCLFLFILLAPFFYALLSKSRKPAWTLALLLACCLAVGLCAVARDTYMGLARLPIFVLGMAFAMDWEHRLPRWLVNTLWTLAFALGLAAVLLCFARYPELLNDYAMYWHPFVLMMPPLCVFLAFLLHKADGARVAFAPLRLLGQSSFEIYLLNIWLVELAKRQGVTDGWTWALLCAGNLVAGMLLHQVVAYATQKIKALSKV